MIMLAHEVAARIENAESVFVSYLNILREADRAKFSEALNGAGLRLWKGEIDYAEYAGIFGELKRDAKGTAQGYREADRSMIGSAPRIVTMPRRRVSA